MKNIYEDETLPSGNAKPPMPRNDSKAPMPSRPRRQVTPPPMKQMPTQPVYMPTQPAVPPQGVAPQPGAYPYAPYPPQGQPYPQGVAYYPVYDPNTQPPVYPQGVPYMPYGYMPPQAAPMAPAPQQVEEEPKEEYDPGTRVLYQSPDFDNNGSSAFSENVGANFANMMKQASEEAEKEKEKDEEVIEVPVSDGIDFEEVSIDLPKSSPKKPPVIRSAPPIISTSTLTDEDIYTDTKTGDISFSAYNAVKPTMDVEEFEQELPPYEEEADEEFIDEDVEETDNGEKKTLSLPKSEIIRRSVLVVAIIAIVISAGMLLNEWRLSIQNDNLMEEVEGLIDTEPTTKKKDKNKDKTTTEPLTPEEQWAQVKEDYPNVLFPANIQLRYAKLYGENQDFVGYISIDAFNLNLPVVQTNNNDTYLKKNFYGSSTKYGCPFVDYLNNMSYNHLDMNTVIYGHHMNNGTIFGALDKYKTITGYKSAPVITFNTLYTDYKWKVIGVMITNGHSKDDNGYLFPYTFTNLSSTSKMSAYLSELAQRSLYDTGVDVLPTDKLLTLSTCSHEFEDARLVVVARLVRPGESAEVDTSRVVVNSKPRYPQAYYNKKGMTNPYKNSSKWVAN